MSSSHEEQLSGPDQLFIQQEAPRTPKPISPVIIYDVSEVECKLRFEEVLRGFERNFHKSTVCRRRREEDARRVDRLTLNAPQSRVNWIPWASGSSLE